MCRYVCGHVCAIGSCVEVQGQFVGVISLLCCMTDLFHNATHTCMKHMPHQSNKPMSN